MNNNKKAEVGKKEGQNNKMRHQQRTHGTHWTHLSYCSKLAKISTNLDHFDQSLNGSMSSDLFVDTGHSALFSCSITLYYKSSFSIFGLISCVKSVLKRVKDKKIKKFYWSEGMSSVSSVSRAIIITVIRNLLKNNTTNNNNKHNEKEEKVKK